MTAAAPPVGAVEPSANLRDTRGALLRRLLLPRGVELFFKWAVLPVGALAALSARAAPPSARELGQLLLLWIVAEQLVYQARYQLNDLRDRRTDALHPGRAQRGRLSFPWTRTRAVAVWGTVVFRLVLAVVLVVAVLDGRPQQAGAVFLVLVLVISLAYEAARERVRREPVDPMSSRARNLGLPVLVLVPLGYGLRVWTGFHAVGGGAATAGLATLLVLAVLSLYTGTVLLSWAIEGTSFVRRDGTVEPQLGKRAHLALVVRHARLLDPAEPTPARPSPTQLVLARDRPARGRADLRIWDAAAGTALVLSYAVAAYGVDAGPATTAGLVGAGLVSALLPLLLRGALSRPPGPWDARAPWLGNRTLATTAAVELGVLLLAVLVLLVRDPAHARLLWFPAYVLFQAASVRASSSVRGYGPLSLVRRPLAWARRRARPVVE